MQVAALNHAVTRVLPHMPKSLVWRFSRRYIAGTTPEDAFRTIRSLNRQGIAATMDVLGEDIRQLPEARGYRDLYLRVLAEIEAQELDSHISIKLTEMGLRLDEKACRGIVAELAAAAGRHGCFMRIDMEDSSVTAVTLDIYRALRREHLATGAVIQACLHRSEADVKALLDEGIANIRLCKGIYIEPPDIAYQDREEIRDAFRRLLELLVAGGAERVAIATHDPPLVEHALRAVRQAGLPKDRYEFQMLLGVAERLRNTLVADGHPLRVYVPFGEAWFAYSMRRLRENPQIAGHVMRNLLLPG